MSLKHAPDDTPLEQIADTIALFKRLNPELGKPSPLRPLWQFIHDRYPIETESKPIEGVILTELEQFMVDLFEQSNHSGMMELAMDKVKDWGLTRAAKVINETIERDNLLKMI